MWFLGNGRPNVSPGSGGRPRCRRPRTPAATRRLPPAVPDMDLVQIYQCFCDRTRLRILNLLAKSPLCVCHFQTILGEPQVKISKHLGYLRERGMVDVERDQHWMVYSLPKKRSAELETNLKCLRDCVHSDKVFAR